MKRPQLELLLLLILFYAYNAFGQELSELPEAYKNLNINGYLSTNHSYNSQSLNNNYTSYFTGNISCEIAGLSLPLSFLYSNHKTTFSHPFNQFAFHPSYKWIKTYMGTVSMNFSPYTLNGHLFTGAGFELTPEGIIRVSAMYGRLLKAVEYDSLNGIEAYFKRMGGGIKIGIEKDRDFFSVILFKAKDDENSLYQRSEHSPSPKENGVFSVIAGKSFGKKLNIMTEISSSAISEDLNSNTEAKKSKSIAAWMLPVRSSTTFRNAFKANMNYMLNNSSLGIGYERIDPEYRTFGSYYFTNNLENITSNFNTSFKENKISLSGNLGLQKDNLDKNKLNNNIRFVGSGSLNYAPDNKLNLNFSYSNFTSFTNVRSTFDYINQLDPIETWDTLNYRQISQNINLNSNYQLVSNKEQRQSISTNITYQLSNNESGNSTSEKAKFYNINSSYILSFIPQKLNISTTINLNKNNTDITKSFAWGPGITVSKSYWDQKLKTTFSTNYNNTSSENSTGRIINLRTGLTYTIKKQHNLNLSGQYQKRSSNGKESTAISRQTGLVTFGYSYNFSLLSNNNDKNNGSL